MGLRAASATRPECREGPGCLFRCSRPQICLRPTASAGTGMSAFFLLEWSRDTTQAWLNAFSLLPSAFSRASRRPTCLDCPILSRKSDRDRTRVMHTPVTARSARGAVPPCAGRGVGVLLPPRFEGVQFLFRGERLLPPPTQLCMWSFLASAPSGGRAQGGKDSLSPSSWNPRAVERVPSPLFNPTPQPSKGLGRSQDARP